MRQFKIFHMSHLETLFGICVNFLAESFDTDVTYVYDPNSAMDHFLHSRVDEDARLRDTGRSPRLCLKATVPNWIYMDEEAVKGFLSHRDLLSNLMREGISDADCSCKLFSPYLVFNCGQV